MTAKELRKKWIEALRSGDYKQGRDMLRYVDQEGDERFCCLGVLCDVWDKKYWTPGDDDQGEHRELFSYKGINNYPPVEVCEAAGFIDDPQKSLVRMNDDERRDFSFIADQLEKHPEDFFFMKGEEE